MQIFLQLDELFDKKFQKSDFAFLKILEFRKLKKKSFFEDFYPIPHLR